MLRYLALLTILVFCSPAYAGDDVPALTNAIASLNTAKQELCTAALPAKDLEICRVSYDAVITGVQARLAIAKVRNLRGPSNLKDDELLWKMASTVDTTKKMWLPSDLAYENDKETLKQKIKLLDDRFAKPGKQAAN